MATPLTDVIRYLRTAGGSQGEHPNFADRTVIRYFIDEVTMTETEESAGRAAFANWAQFIGRPLLETSDSNAANIILKYVDMGEDGPLGHAVQVLDKQYVELNRFDFERGGDIPLGSYEQRVLLHEIGHALGLSHPGAYDGEDSEPLTYGVPGEPGVSNVYLEDNWRYTLMSYFDEFAVENAFSDGDPETSPDAPPDLSFLWTPGFSRTPMLHDIAAIQSIYGGRTTRPFDDVYGYNAGDFLYRFSHDPDATDFEKAGTFTIYDTGGTDTLDGSGTNPVTIDLREGAYSSIGYEMVNNVAIAFGTVIENAIGGDFVDRITGNDAPNVLYGGGFTDVLFGLGGNDILFGGAGGDHIDGGDGFDTASYEDATRAIIRTLTAGGGDILRDEWISIEAFRLTSLDDLFYARGEGLVSIDDIVHGGDGSDEIRGRNGNDTLFGDAAIDTLYGDAGNDNLYGGTEADTMYGGNGNDVYEVDNAGDVVVEAPLSFGRSEGTSDEVRSSIDFALTGTAAGVENLTLTGAAVRGTGNGSSNTIFGNGLANILDGGASVDTLAGRGGNDTYIIDNAGDVVDETAGLSADIDTVLSSVTYSLAAATVRGNVEKLTLTGIAAINATGNGLDNTLTGNNAGNTLTGNAGSDKLFGNGGGDTLYGGSEDDTLDGGTESDYLAGGLGSDSYVLDEKSGSDKIVDEGGTKDAILVTDMALIKSAARAGNDLILTHASGALTIVNHFTTGTIEALTSKTSSVVLATGLIGGNLSGIIAGSNASETLDGRGGDDFLYGRGGRDILLGGLGNDLLDGGKGADRLDGGEGDDIMTGGLGGDTFVFARGYGNDVVRGYSFSADRLDLSGFDTGPAVTRSAHSVSLDFGGGDVLTLDVMWMPSNWATRLDKALGDLEWQIA